MTFDERAKKPKRAGLPRNQLRLRPRVDTGALEGAYLGNDTRLHGGLCLLFDGHRARLAPVRVVGTPIDGYIDPMADNSIVLWWQRRSPTQKVLVGVGSVGLVAAGAFIALPALFSALTAAITAIQNAFVGDG